MFTGARLVLFRHHCVFLLTLQCHTWFTVTSHEGYSFKWLATWLFVVSWQRNKQSPALLALFVGNLPVTGGFPSQKRASNFHLATSSYLPSFLLLGSVRTRDTYIPIGVENVSFHGRRYIGIFFRYSDAEPYTDQIHSHRVFQQQ